MSVNGLSGYWKGSAVVQNVVTTVHLYFEQKGNTLQGKFEAPEMPGPKSKGDITGTVDGNNIRFATSDGDEFIGQLAGENPSEDIIHGTMHPRGNKNPVGTLTLFPTNRGHFVEMYQIDIKWP